MKAVRLIERNDGAGWYNVTPMTAYVSFEEAMAHAIERHAAIVALDKDKAEATRFRVVKYEAPGDWEKEVERAE